MEPALMRASVKQLFSELSPSAATALASTSCRACIESTVGPFLSSIAFRKALRLECKAEKSHLCLCLHKRGCFLVMRHLQTDARSPGLCAHLMDMVSMVSVAMLVLLPMAVPLNAVMMWMHAVLGPCGLQNTTEITALTWNALPEMCHISCRMQRMHCECQQYHWGGRPILTGVIVM